MKTAIETSHGMSDTPEWAARMIYRLRNYGCLYWIMITLLPLTAIAGGLYTCTHAVSQGLRSMGTIFIIFGTGFGSAILAWIALAFLACRRSATSTAQDANQ